MGCDVSMSFQLLLGLSFTNLNKLQMNDVMLTRLEVIHVLTYYDKVVQTFVNDNVLQLVKGN